MPALYYDYPNSCVVVASTGTCCTSCTPLIYSTTNATTAATAAYIDMNAQQYFSLAQQRGAYQYAQQQAQQAIAEQAIAAQHQSTEQKLARQRSRELLLEHLTDGQRETFEKNNWFVVQGGKSKKEYRIRTSSGYSRNIDEMRGDKVVARLCFHASYEIPVYDHYLSQKIALELDEEHFLKIANRSSVAYAA